MTIAGLIKRTILYSAVILFTLSFWPAKADTKQQSDAYSSIQDDLARGDVDEAILDLRLLLQDNPLDPNAHYMLGSLLALQGNENQAAIGFQRAITLDPTYPEALHNLGTLMLQRGQAVPAAELLEAAIFHNPDYIPPYNSLAKAYYLAGLPEFAIGTYEEVLRRDVGNTIANQNLTLLLAAAETEPNEKNIDSPDQGKDKVQDKDKAQGKDQKKDPPGEMPVPYSDAKAKDLRELCRDLPYLSVEERAGMLTLTGWTRGPREREMLDRILAGGPKVLDLTGMDVGDPQRMIEVDAVIFIIIGVESESIGFNFLELINLSYTTFSSSSNKKVAWKGLLAPAFDKVLELPSNGWLLVASVDYDVNIANAVQERVAVLARPHLTTLSGTPAHFLAGGEWVFKVSGLNTGSIKPYPFGTSLDVTPTLLRTPGEDGEPRIHLDVKAQRTSILELLIAEQEEDIVFDKLVATSQAVLNLGETLILSGLSQRESRTSYSGVPILKEIPLIKYLFSSKKTVETNTSVIILLTPRDPAFINERNRKSLSSFIQKRRDFLKAQQGTEEDMRQFKKKYPNWYALPPNRFASHFFLTRASDMYRRVSGADIIDEDLDLDLLGDVVKDPKEKKRKKKKNPDDDGFDDENNFND